MIPEQGKQDKPVTFYTGEELRSDCNDRIRGALARSYCTERNKHKVLDSDLIEDMVTELNRLKKGDRMEEQHEPEMTQEEKDAQEWMNASLGKPEKYVHYVIQVEPNNTIGLYKDGKYVKSIDFWILDGRGNQ